MASNVNPGQIPVVGLLQGSQAASSVSIPAGGKPSANKTPAADVASVHANAIPAPARESHPATVAAQQAYAVKTPAPRTADPQSAQSFTASLNKHLNDSGRPAQFRVDPNSGDKMIQEINPANGEIIGEFSVDEFPALARSIGASGLMVDDLA